MENPTLNLGQKIRKLCKLKGYSQEAVATELNISQNTYSKIELGKVKLTVQRLSQIAKVLGLDPVDIMKFDESMLFNNHDQNGGKVDNALVDNTSEQLIQFLRAQVEHLKGEVSFLRNLVRRKN